MSHRLETPPKSNAIRDFYWRGATFHLLPLLVLQLSHCAVVVLPSMSFTTLGFQNRSLLCPTLDEPSTSVSLAALKASAEFARFSSSCAPPLTACAWKCTVYEDCVSYKYNENVGACELFLARPLYYYASDESCVNYRITEDYNDGCLTTTDVLSRNASSTPGTRKMIPDRCCDFPFTYGGQLFLTCAQNNSDDTDIGCFIGNLTWISCLPPADYTARYAKNNFTLVNFDPITLLFVDGWYVIMSRGIGSIANFTRSWADYRDGFGDPPNGEYWLGLEMMHQMSAKGRFRLRFEVQTIGSNSIWMSAEYASFVIDTEAKGYSLTVYGYNGGDAGDVMNPTNVAVVQNGSKFSTFDADNDNSPSDNCAVKNSGGFWFNNCLYFVLTSSSPVLKKETNGAIASYNLKKARILAKRTNKAP